MNAKIDLFDSTYSNFTEQVLQTVREEAFLGDLGQNSWTTGDEYDRFLGWLDLQPGHHVLEVACGSGGPALYIGDRAGCAVTGIDINPAAIATAVQSAVDAGRGQQVGFREADANAPLPFEDRSFDALVCIDSMNHFPDRITVFREWRRVLHYGGRAVFTDPVVVTGPLTSTELALRSSIGLFLFVPPGINERLIASAGLRLVKQVDVTENAALVSGRWHDARRRHREALVRIEGEERFEGLQAFFAAVYRLASERRLSRVAYLVEKAGS